MARSTPPRRPDDAPVDWLFCFGCETWLPPLPVFFYRKPNRSRGWSSRCKNCINQDSRQMRRRYTSGKPVPLKKLPRKDLPIETVCELHRNHLSIKKIAARFGVSRERILEVLHSQGVLIRRFTSEQPFYVNSEGYRVVTIDSADPYGEMSYNGGLVLEHRLVMARLLDRPLRKNETVHHINGDRQDNRPDNLQLRFGGHGQGVAMECRDCGSFNVAAVELA